MSFRNGIHSVQGRLMPEGALTLFTVYVTHIASLWVKHIVFNLKT